MKLLDDKKVFLKELGSTTSAYENATWTLSPDVGVFCPGCGDARRVQVKCMHAGSVNEKAPMLLHLTCMQCEALFTAVLYKTLKGTGYALFTDRDGGLSTPHTPDPVKYYLDQAHKAAASGANSAATAMYRGALEHILFDHGFTKGMLGAKLNDLEAAVLAGTAPKWARDLETEFLAVLKELGNGAIHPNDGDVSRQEALDSELIANVKLTFIHLLDLVYEMPQKRAAHLAALKTSASLLTK